MSQATRCRMYSRIARDNIDNAVANSPTQATGNRLAHIRKKLNELLEVLAAERIAECQDDNDHH